MWSSGTCSDVIVFLHHTVGSEEIIGHSSGLK